MAGSAAALLLPGSSRPALPWLLLLWASSCLLPCPAQPEPQRPPPRVGADGAFEDCPCVDHERNAYWFPGSSTIQLADGRSVPRSYGSGQCSDWDSDTCSADHPSPYCGLRWCFVDPAECSRTRHFRKSDVLDDVWISYLTCGNASPPPTWEGGKLYVHTFGRKLSVDAEGGWTFRFDIFLRLAYQTIREMGLSMDDVEYRDISNTSRSMFSSSYTACVYDTLLGNIDLCVGDFWDTDERRRLGGLFSSIVLAEPIYLWGYKTQAEESILDVIWKPLSVFSPGLWGLCAAMLLVSGVLIAGFEWKHPESDFQENTTFGLMGMGAYVSFFSFANAGVSCTPVTISGRVMALGLGMFILIAIASFTANTATFLIANTPKAPINSLQQAVDQDKKICISPGFRSTFASLYPDAEHLAVDARSGRNFYADLASDKCDLGILTDTAVYDEWRRARQCNLVSIGEPLVIFPTGYFASHRIHASFSATLNHKRIDGSWMRLERMLKTDNCKREQALAANQLGVQHMAGNCMLLGFCSVVAIAVRIAEKLERTKIGQAAEQRVVQIMHEAEAAITIDSTPKLTEHGQQRIYCESQLASEEASDDKLNVIHDMLLELAGEIRQRRGNEGLQHWPHHAPDATMQAAGGSSSEPVAL